MESVSSEAGSVHAALAGGFQVDGHAVQVVKDRMLGGEGGRGGRRGRKHSIPHGQQVERPVFE